MGDRGEAKDQGQESNPGHCGNDWDLLKVPWHATRCGVISRYKPFWKSAPHDITGGRVHLDV